MSVNRDDLEVILTEFPRQELKKIASERDIEVDSTKVEDYIESIKRDSWTNEGLQNLVGRLNRVLEENEPMGFYICEISDGPDLEEFADSLETRNPAEFNDDGEPVESGYDIDEVSEKELTYRNWKVQEKSEFNRITGTPRYYTDISMTSVRIDAEEGRVYMNTKNYLKAKSIRGFLKDEGFELEEVGHKTLTPESAKEQVESFVDEMEEKLEEVNNE
ncbi:hypothetical protein [Halosimplex amylolyticum]|uniref:hypothetical protein n=1 Tax=Halosimplex amylolyticum TaxID=3396616 RepID=UPI003F5725D9